MAVNPAGYVSPIDGGNPRIFTGIALETMSGGQLVFASGAADGVSSGLNSFATTDIGVALGASGLKFSGVLVADATSGNACAVATRGMVVMTAGGSTINGENVAAIDGDCVAPVVTAGHVIGRAIIGGTSGNYTLIDLNS